MVEITWLHEGTKVESVEIEREDVTENLLYLLCDTWSSFGEVGDSIAIQNVTK